MFLLSKYMVRNGRNVGNPTLTTQRPKLGMGFTMVLQPTNMVMTRGWCLSPTDSALKRNTTRCPIDAGHIEEFQNPQRPNSMIFTGEHGDVTKPWVFPPIEICTSVMFIEL